MIKKKFYFKDMEFQKTPLNSCFTDDSYVVINMPSYMDRVKLINQFDRSGSNDAYEKNCEIATSFVDEVFAMEKESGELITDLETLTIYQDGLLLLGWLIELLQNGFVPKKTSAG